MTFWIKPITSCLSLEPTPILGIIAPPVESTAFSHPETSAEPPPNIEPLCHDQKPTIYEMPVLAKSPAVAIHRPLEQALVHCQITPFPQRKKLKPTIESMPKELKTAIRTLKQGRTLTVLHCCCLKRIGPQQFSIATINNNGFFVQRGNTRYDFFGNTCIVTDSTGKVSQCSQTSLDLADGDVIYFRVGKKPDTKIIGYSFILSEILKEPKKRTVKKFDPKTYAQGSLTPKEKETPTVRRRHGLSNGRNQEFHNWLYLKNQLKDLALGFCDTVVLGARDIGLLGCDNPVEMGVQIDHAHITFKNGCYYISSDYPVTIIRDGIIFNAGTRHNLWLSCFELQDGDKIKLAPEAKPILFSPNIQSFVNMTRAYSMIIDAWTYIATQADVLALFSEADNLNNETFHKDLILEIPVYKDIPASELTKIKSMCEKALKTYGSIAGFQIIFVEDLIDLEPHKTKIVRRDPIFFRSDIGEQRQLPKQKKPMLPPHADQTISLSQLDLVAALDSPKTLEGYSIGNQVTILRSRQGLRGFVHVPEKGWTIVGFDTQKKLAIVRRAMTADEKSHQAPNGFIERALEILGRSNTPERLELRLPLSHIATSAEILKASAGDQTAFWHLSRRDILLRDHAKMTHEEFIALFGANFHQANVGNCYLIALFKSLTSDPDNFEALMRLSIKPLPNGWQVTIPLGQLNGRTIIITKENLKPTPNKQPNDKRSKLNPVQGPDGFKILEAVYCKLVQNEFTTTGAPVDRTHIDQGGFSEEAVRTLLGKGIFTERYGTYGGFDYNSFILEVKKYLLNFHRNKDVATTAVLGPELEKKLMIHDPVTGENHSILTRHAYTIATVEYDYPKDQTGQKQIAFVVLYNPHNNSQKIRLSIDAYLAIFKSIDACELAVNQLFT